MTWLKGLLAGQPGVKADTQREWRIAKATRSGYAPCEGCQERAVVLDGAGDPLCQACWDDVLADVEEVSRG